MYDCLDKQILEAITEAYESREDYSWDSGDARDLAGIALWQAFA